MDTESIFGRRDRSRVGVDRNAAAARGCEPKALGLIPPAHTPHTGGTIKVQPVKSKPEDQNLLSVLGTMFQPHHQPLAAPKLYDVPGN